MHAGVPCAAHRISHRGKCSPWWCPLSSDLAAYKTFTAKFWPRPSCKSPSHLVSCSLFARKRSDGCRVSGFGFRVSGVGCRASGFEFRVSGVGFRVSGFGFRVKSDGTVNTVRCQRQHPPHPPTQTRRGSSFGCWVESCGSIPLPGQGSSLPAI